MEKYEDLPIGIDLGTTFSCIGVYRNAAVEIIPNEKGDRTTPSVVSFLDGDIYVGEQTEYKRLKDPKNKIYAVKRIIGRNFDDEEVQEDIRSFSYKIVSDYLGRPVIEVNSNGIKRYSPEQIAAKILAKLKQSAESFLGQNIKKVVITVPAYFTERQKQATKNAGEIAGLEVIKIINEPTAASLAYGFGKYNNNFGKLLNKKNIFDEISPMTNRSAPTPIMEKKKDCQNILVFDLGGGTLDVTLLELEEGDITVKSHSGKMHLGGEDFDNQIMQYCINQFRYKTSIDLNKEEYLKQKTRLKEHCEKAKKKLSQQKEVEIEVESIAKGKDFYLKLSRAKFEDLCKDIFEKCKLPINEVLNDAKCKPQDVDEIVLVGGSTRIPKIQEMLKDYFFGKELNKRLNPDEAVAYGATIEAALQMGKYSEDVALLDVCPFSLGIAVVNRQDDKVEDMLMSKVIKRGSKLPCKKMEIFNPAEDYQKSILFRVYEGENQYVKNNYLLGKFRLVNLPMKPKNEVDFEVTFDLDEDSILTVTAVEKNNKSNCNSIVIKNDKGGLSKNEIEEAKKRQNDEYGSNLEPAMVIERNYKKEINKLYNEINTLTDPKEQYYTIIKLKNTIENFVNSFNKENMENETYKQKMYYYLTYLFNCYSSLLNFKNLISDEEKDDIISKVKNYLQNFEKTGTSYGSTLVKIFKDNENDIFGEFCIQILGYYSQRGTEYYANPFSNEKKNAKHYLEEALSIIRKYSVKEKIQNNSYLLDRFISIEDNINELLNILKAESIEKYCASFSKDMLIRENEFSTEEKKIDILDRFKDALAFLKNPRKRADKLLKAIYLANIVKIEFKMFNSNNYDALLKMIDDCISLKLDVPQGCGSRVEGPQLEWFNEICKIKQEIEKKKEQLKLNPKEDENKIKEELKYTLDEINFYYQKGKIDFFFYVLKYHKPIGLDDDYIFQTRGQLENKYYEDTKKFLKKMRRLYNPVRYKGDKEEEQKRHAIMQEIQKLLNEFE
jgi:molecular chaperone DnaK (HSP70)